MNTTQRYVTRSPYSIQVKPTEQCNHDNKYIYIYIYEILQIQLVHASLQNLCLFVLCKTLLCLLQQTFYHH